MRAVSQQEKARLASIVRRLHAVHLDGDDPVADILPEMHALLGVDSLGMYSVREHATGWEFDRFSLYAMPGERIRQGMLHLFERCAVSVLFYDVARPAAAQRNR